MATLFWCPLPTACSVKITKNKVRNPRLWCFLPKKGIQWHQMAPKKSKRKRRNPDLIKGPRGQRTEQDVREKTRERVRRLRERRRKREEEIRKARSRQPDDIESSSDSEASVEEVDVAWAEAMEDVALTANDDRGTGS